ncbi:MAG: hypothetical protein LBG80_20320 [Bacteroidales bacterium]|jgi:hypothetical protein|nr:hypothetical protein [Bacteroidales bacterium]
MKKILFLIIVFPLTAFSQSVKYDNGKCTEGNCLNGYGTFEFHSGQFAGDKYVGYFKNGKFHGRGRYDYDKSKAYYDGLWNNGIREDTNAVYVSVNYKYRGSYKNGKQNGEATISFISGKRAGDTYTGSIVDNKFNGEGSYVYNPDNLNRIKYTGHFENNKFNGEGALYYKNGDIDDGLWIDDVFQGTKIGVYQDKPVLKKGDTIITHNNRYLLSQQTVAGDDGYVADINVSVRKGTFIIEKNIYGKTAVIGYITHSGRDYHFYSKEKEQIGICNTIPVYKDGDIIMVAAAKYDLKEQERGNLLEASKTDYIIATLQGGQFNIKNIIGIVKVDPNNKYSFIQINSRYLGTYSGKDVVYFDNIRCVAVGNLNPLYHIDWQIYQNGKDDNFNSFIRYYLFYNGDTKPDANFYNNNSKYDPIGWIDMYSETNIRFGTKSTTKDIGLNYFASYYIGPNNPKYNNKDNFDLKPQDEVDAAAREHDICYSKHGIKGVPGVFATTKGQDCDHVLVNVCRNIKGETSISELLISVSSSTIYDYKTTSERAESVYLLFSKVSTGKSIAGGDVPAIIDFTASATKTGLGFATTATTGFFATTGSLALAVPVLSVAAVNLLQTEAKCLYSFLKDNAPSHCYSTMGIITHAWDVKAAKEMVTGVFSSAGGKGITGGLKKININTAIKVGKTSYDGGQVATQTATTLNSLFSTQDKNNK